MSPAQRSCTSSTSAHLVSNREDILPILRESARLAKRAALLDLQLWVAGFLVGGTVLWIAWLEFGIPVFQIGDPQQFSRPPARVSHDSWARLFSEAVLLVFEFSFNGTLLLLSLYYWQRAYRASEPPRVNSALSLLGIAYLLTFLDHCGLCETLPNYAVEIAVFLTAGPAIYRIRQETRRLESEAENVDDKWLAAILRTPRVNL